jgi:hypothetical protein
MGHSPRVQRAPFGEPGRPDVITGGTGRRRRSRLVVAIRLLWSRRKHRECYWRAGLGGFVDIAGVGGGATQIEPVVEGELLQHIGRSREAQPASTRHPRKHPETPPRAPTWFSKSHRGRHHRMSDGHFRDGRSVFQCSLPNSIVGFRAESHRVLCLPASVSCRSLIAYTSRRQA